MFWAPVMSSVWERSRKTQFQAAHSVVDRTHLCTTVSQREEVWCSRITMIGPLWGWRPECSSQGLQYGLRGSASGKSSGKEEGTLPAEGMAFGSPCVWLQQVFLEELKIWRQRALRCRYQGWCSERGWLKGGIGRGSMTLGGQWECLLWQGYWQDAYDNSCPSTVCRMGFRKQWQSQETNRDTESPR